MNFAVGSVLLATDVSSMQRKNQMLFYLAKVPIKFSPLDISVYSLISVNNCRCI